MVLTETSVSPSQCQIGSKYLNRHRLVSSLDLTEDRVLQLLGLLLRYLNGVVQPSLGIMHTEV